MTRHWSAVTLALVVARRGGAALLGVMVLGALLLAVSPAAAQDAPARLGPNSPKTLTIGSKAPDFSLPAVDGKTYSLKDFDSSKVLAVVFTCDHCPVAEQYENRIKKLTADYRSRGVAVVAIQPNNPDAVGLEERGHTDLGDSLPEMKIRAAYRNFNFPYLYDGETQGVGRQYGPIATPHIFIFDEQRTLKYQGHIDNNPREGLVTVQTARNAIDAVLAGKPIAVENTPAVGCSIKWMSKQATVQATASRFDRRPVTLEPINAEQLTALRQNKGTDKILLINFWATWCGPCIEEFPELQKMARMYQKRTFDLVTVSTNYPDEQASVLKVLQEERAVTKNYIFGTMDPYQLIGAFDKTWTGGVPFTMVIGTNGEVLYKSLGTIDVLEIRRTLLKYFPDDQYMGQHSYWNQPLDK